MFPAPGGDLGPVADGEGDIDDVAFGEKFAVGAEDAVAPISRAAGIKRAGVEGKVVVHHRAEIDDIAVETAGARDRALEAEFLREVVGAQRSQVDGQHRGRFGEEVVHVAEVGGGDVVVVRVLRAFAVHAGVVDAVDVHVPDVRNEACVADFRGFAEQLEAGGEDEAAGFEQAVAEVGDVDHHVFVEEVVAHLLVEDDVHGGVELEVLAVGADELDVFDAIVGSEGFGVFEDDGVVDGVDLGGTAAGGEGGEDAGAGAEIDDAVAGRDVAADGGVVKIHARLVGEHLLLLVELGEIAAVEIAVTLIRGRLGGGLGCGVNPGVKAFAEEELGGQLAAKASQRFEKSSPGTAGRGAGHGWRESTGISDLIENAFSA